MLLSFPDHRESVTIRITKTCLYNFDPLKPHFYIKENWGLQGYILFFLFLLRNMKNIRIFYLKIFSFFGGKIFNIFE